MCISWTRKGLISLMHGISMKITDTFLSRTLNSPAGCRSETCHGRSDFFHLFVVLRLITSAVQGV